MLSKRIFIVLVVPSCCVEKTLAFVPQVCVKQCGVERENKCSQESAILPKPSASCLFLFGRSGEAKQADREITRLRLEYLNFRRLQQKYGRNQRGDIGELDAIETRAVYKRVIRDGLEALAEIWQPTKEYAKLAFLVRQAAESYARYRTKLDKRFFSVVFDGWNSLVRYGKFYVSFDDFWDYKYEAIRAQNPEAIEAELEAMTANAIRKSSKKTNIGVDTYVAFLKAKTNQTTFFQFLKEESIRSVAPIPVVRDMYGYDCVRRVRTAMYGRGRGCDDLAIFTFMDKAAG